MKFDNLKLTVNNFFVFQREFPRNAALNQVYAIGRERNGELWLLVQTYPPQIWRATTKGQYQAFHKGNLNDMSSALSALHHSATYHDEHPLRLYLLSEIIHESSDRSVD